MADLADLVFTPEWEKTQSHVLDNDNEIYDDGRGSRREPVGPPPHRSLAGGGGDGPPAPVDYTVFSVAATTLGIILVVELIRHRLDVAAVGRPLYRTVLEGVYQELSTLGIVEFFIFLLHKYYKDLNVEQELVFADVHFTLFYTAIVNAFQSVLLAVFVRRNSNRMWVETEAVDAHHYVEIREEFDRVDRELRGHDDNDDDDHGGREHGMEDADDDAVAAAAAAAAAAAGDKNQSNAGTSPGLEEDSNDDNKNKTKKKRIHGSRRRSVRTADALQEQEFQFSWSSLRSLYRRLLRSVKYPVLSRKHRNLLLQIRYHDLKFHFIEMNDLPVTLPISDYLKRSEIHVLKKLVHITSFAWLLLTGAVVLVYFLMSVVVMVTHEDGVNGPVLVGRSLTLIWYAVMIFFVLLSLLIFNRMKLIFRHIMTMKLVNQETGKEFGVISNQNKKRRASSHSHPDDVPSSSPSQFEEGKRQQMAMFWGGHPRYIIVMIQFMQFGFAVAISILLVFWDDLNVYGREGGFAFVVGNGGSYALITGICYIAFVAIMSHVIPRFTLCSSLGQMVNPRRLQETLAAHRLELAKRERLRLKDEMLSRRQAEYYYDYQDENHQSSGTKKDSATGGGNAAIAASSQATGGGGAGALIASNLMAHNAAGLITTPIHQARKGLEFLITGVGPDGGGTTTSGGGRFDPSADANLMLELLHTDTQKLRQTLPAEAPDGDEERKRRIQERRTRRKSASDGVAAMRAMRPISEIDGIPAGELAGDKAQPQQQQQQQQQQDAASSAPPPRRPRPRRSKAVSAAASIQMMRDATIAEEEDSSTASFALSKFGSTTSFTLPKMGSAASLSSHMTNRQSHVSVSASWASGSVATRATMEGRRQLSDLDLTASKDANEGGQAPSAAQSRTAAGRVSRRPDRANNATMDQMRGDASDGKNNPTTFGSIDEHPDVPTSVSTSSTTPRSHPEVIAEMSRGSKAASGAENRQATIRDETADVLGDRGTVTTAEDDDNSDDGDIPDADEVEIQASHEPPPPRITMADHLRIYFRGKRYQYVSGVFGTLVCFFLVAMRFEVLLLGTGYLVDNDNTWHFGVATSFYSELALLGSFIAKDVCAICLFCCNLYDDTDRVILTSVLLDLPLSIACFVLLVISETRRCCDDEHHEDRLLAAASDESKYKEDYPYGVDPIPCCPAFGTRLYGGVGNIEPFTSLIILRILRFVISQRIVAPRRRKGEAHLDYHATGHSTDPHEVSTIRRHPLEPLYDRTKHAKKKKGHVFQEKEGSIVELWKAAQSEFPDIAEKHGQFSSELLQVMLGIEVLDDSEANSTSRASTAEPSLPTVHEQQEAETGTEQTSSLKGDSNDEDELAASLSVSPPKKEAASTRRDERPGRRFARRPSIHIDKKYAGLSHEAQACILAGKLGLPAVVADEQRKRGRGDLPRGAPSDRALAFGPFDDETADVNAAMFISPSARLVRSMRRCDRKLLPLLDHWTTVDVVMTKYEIVYFEALDLPTDDDDKALDEKQRRMLAVREALAATKGGKDLRLLDVAFGRRVVGHQELSGVDSVHVERALPSVEGTTGGSSGALLDGELVPDEYWKRNLEGVDFLGPRSGRWKKVFEDRLKIVAGKDTLCFRFYSDLENCESHRERVRREREGTGPIFKNNALQWAQTMVRLCGSTQLKQKLPHFGDDNDDELRDYLEVVEGGERGQRTGMQRGRARANTSNSDVVQQFNMSGHSEHRGFFRKGTLAASEQNIGSKQSSADNTRMAYSEGIRSKSPRRTSSVDDDALFLPKKTRFDRILKRSQTVGEGNAPLDQNPSSHDDASLGVLPASTAFSPQEVRMASSERTESRSKSPRRLSSVDDDAVFLPKRKPLFDRRLRRSRTSGDGPNPNPSAHDDAAFAEIMPTPARKQGLLVEP